MISLCLPVYRYDVRPLVGELLRQAAALPHPVELLVYDDASPADGDWGRSELRRTGGITYRELTRNHGRAAIRNRLAREARYDYVVLMDADGWPNPTYLANWLGEVLRLRARPSDRAYPFVLSGGRTYAERPPARPELRLHWWYGRRRESPPAARRNERPLLGFQSNNFLAARSVLLAYPFPAAHRGYGHEDTLWGQRFGGTDVRLAHLDNPVEHRGLEPAETFLAKQREALTNLTLLRRQTPHLRTRLTDLTDRFPLAPRLAAWLPEKRLVRYLTDRDRPNLLALDLLKLRWWAEVDRRV